MNFSDKLGVQVPLALIAATLWGSRRIIYAITLNGIPTWKALISIAANVAAVLFLLTIVGRLIKGMEAMDCGRYEDVWWMEKRWTLILGITAALGLALGWM